MSASVEIANLCPEVTASPLRNYFGNSLLKMDAEGLEGMVGNVATLLMAQTVCYIKSQGEVVEVLRSDTKTFGRMCAIIETCKTQGGKVRR